MTRNVVRKKLSPISARFSPPFRRGPALGSSLCSSNWCPSNTPIAAPIGPRVSRPRTPPTILPVHFTAIALSPPRQDRCRHPQPSAFVCHHPVPFRYSSKCQDPVWNAPKMTHSMQPSTVFRTALSGLEKIHEGKVRDIYAV